MLSLFYLTMIMLSPFLLTMMVLSLPYLNLMLLSPFLLTMMLKSLALVDNDGATSALPFHELLSPFLLIMMLKSVLVDCHCSTFP